MWEYISVYNNWKSPGKRFDPNCNILVKHESLAVPADCDLHMLSASPEEQKEHKEEEEKTHPHKSVSRRLPSTAPASFIYIPSR